MGTSEAAFLYCQPHVLMCRWTKSWLEWRAELLDWQGKVYLKCHQSTYLAIHYEQANPWIKHLFDITDGNSHVSSSRSSFSSVISWMCSGSFLIFATDRRERARMETQHWVVICRSLENWGSIQLYVYNRTVVTTWQINIFSTHKIYGKRCGRK